MLVPSGGSRGGGGGEGWGVRTPLLLIAIADWLLQVFFAKKNAICSCTQAQTPLHKKSRSAPVSLFSGKGINGGMVQRKLVADHCQCVMHAGDVTST